VSEHRRVTQERNDPIEQALDLFVYAPLGLVLSVREMVPQLAKKGREQVTTAKVIGEFAFTMAQKEAGRRLSSLRPGGAGPAAEAARPRTTPAPPASTPAPSAPASPTSLNGPSAPSVPTAPRPESAAGAGAPPSAAPPPAVSLAIPGYDALSASQVVPRLAGLSATELDAVRRYEESGRGRKTVLNRIAQLQNPV
jgi:hypothetical protein